MQTPTRKMNSGDAYTFALPLASFLPMNGKITVEAWDHNLFEDDVRIMTRDWRPPFGPAVLAGGVGKAIYNVSMDF
jgi:hypothetical protein